MIAGKDDLVVPPSKHCKAQEVYSSLHDDFFALLFVYMFTSYARLHRLCFAAEKS